MHKLVSGQNFPCARGLIGAVANPIRCIIEEGVIYSGAEARYGKPIRVHAFDFTYTLPGI